MNMKDMNFFEPYVFTNSTKFRLSYVFVLFIVVLIAIYSLNWTRINELNVTNDELIESIGQLEEAGYLSAYSDLEKEKESLVNRIQKADNFNLYIEEEYKIDSNLIIKLTELIPEEMYFSEWTFTSEQINMSGFSYDRTVIAEYESKLRSNGYSDVFVGEISENSEGAVVIYEFNFTMSLGGANDENE